MTLHAAHHILGPDINAASFAAHDAFDVVLTETDHFLVDPLIMRRWPRATCYRPRDHYACYGALPLDFDDEARSCVRRATSFLTVIYRAPIFFEHGVFGQTVFHAHLHALPLGAGQPWLRRRGGEMDATPRRLTTCARVRRTGPLLDLDTLPDDSGQREALLFPPI